MYENVQITLKYCSMYLFREHRRIKPCPQHVVWKYQRAGPLLQTRNVPQGRIFL